MCGSDVSAALSNKHTPLSPSDDNSIRLWAGVNARLTAPEEERKETERGWWGEKAEKGKQLFPCLSSAQCSAVPPAVIRWKWLSGGMTARSPCSVSLLLTSKCLEICFLPKKHYLMLIHQRLENARTCKDWTSWTLEVLVWNQTHSHGHQMSFAPSPHFVTVSVVANNMLSLARLPCETDTTSETLPRIQFLSRKVMSC